MTEELVRSSAPSDLPPRTFVIPQAVDQTAGLLAEPSPRTGFEFDVAIVGLGYVGLPTALAFSAAGARVLGVDVSESRLEVIRSQQADLVGSDRERLMYALGNPTFSLTSQAAALQRAAAVIVCVPTPVDAYLVPDLTILGAACRTVVDHAVAGQTVLLTSTTYVGSTRDLLAKPLAERGLLPGVDINVAFSPERINPGMDMAHEEVPRVVGGITPACTEAAAALIHTYTERVHPVGSADAAEMTKLVENTFRAVNIALANEFSDIAQSLGLDVMEVINAASTKPYGYMPFTPGPGVGGHCIPCDPHYLLWQMRKVRRGTPVIEQAMNAIAARPGRVVDRARRILSDRDHGLHHARVLVIGVAYKPDVEDLRESPALEILEGLAENGAEVAYHDSHFPTLRLPDGTELSHQADVEGFDPDLVVLHTAHRSVSLEWVDQTTPVLDTTFRQPHAENVFRL